MLELNQIADLDNDLHEFIPDHPEFLDGMTVNQFYEIADKGEAAIEGGVMMELVTYDDAKALMEDAGEELEDILEHTGMDFTWRPSEETWGQFCVKLLTAGAVTWVNDHTDELLDAIEQKDKEEARMDYDQFNAMFEADCLPVIRSRENGTPDVPMRREAWNNLQDSMGRNDQLATGWGDWPGLPDELEQ